jgi:hypothetical protein
MLFSILGWLAFLCVKPVKGMNQTRMMHNYRMGRRISTPPSPYFAETSQFSELFEEYPFMKKIG